MGSLAQRLGHVFSDPALLRTALTHRSFGQPNNERLEFLGDGILDCVIAAELYARFRVAGRRSLPLAGEISSGRMPCTGWRSNSIWAASCASARRVAQRRRVAGHRCWPMRWKPFSAPSIWMPVSKPRIRSSSGCTRKSARRTEARQFQKDPQDPFAGMAAGAQETPCLATSCWKRAARRTSSPSKWPAISTIPACGRWAPAAAGASPSSTLRNRH